MIDTPQAFLGSDVYLYCEDLFQQHMRYGKALADCEAARAQLSEARRTKSNIQQAERNLATLVKDSKDEKQRTRNLNPNNIMPNEADFFREYLPALFSIVNCAYRRIESNSPPKQFVGSRIKQFARRVFTHRPERCDWRVISTAPQVEELNRYSSLLQRAAREERPKALLLNLSKILRSLEARFVRTPGFKENFASVAQYFETSEFPQSN